MRLWTRRSRHRQRHTFRDASQISRADKSAAPTPESHAAAIEARMTRSTDRRIEGGTGVPKRDVVGQLSRVPLFSGCSRRDLQTIARVVKDIDHAEGTVVAREGEPGVGLFVIVDGTADVTIGGKKKASLGPGDFFGEIALLDGGPRTATVTATSDIQMLGLTEWVFRGLMQEHPTIAVKTLQQMAGRLRSATKAATA